MYGLGKANNNIENNEDAKEQKSLFLEKEYHWQKLTCKQIN